MCAKSEHSLAVVNIFELAKQLQIVARAHISSVILIEVGETIVEEHIALQI